MMEANNLLQQKIDFFQKSADTKEKISKSENDRLKLELELNKIINSDDSKSKFKAIKLKAYYTKLCDDETKSMKRNQQLLTDLQRVDTQFQQLEIKLERLTNLKKECEIYLRTAHPKWTNENRVGLSGTINNDRIHTLNRGNKLIAENLSRIEQLNQSKLNDLYHEESLISKLDQSLNETKSIKTPLLEAVNLFTATSDKYNILNNNNNNESINQSANNSTIKQLVQSVLVQKDEPEIKNSTLKQLIQTVSPKKHTESNQQQQQQTDLGTTFGMNKLLKEYEQEIKRQDSNQIELTQSILLNETFNKKESNNNLDKTVTIDDRKETTLIYYELDINGLYNLLDYVELEIKHLIHPENYYRINNTNDNKTKNEIIRLAQEQKSLLNEMDSLSVANVIKDELKNVITNYTSRSCLFDDDLLNENLENINDNLVRSYLRNRSDLNLWDRLLKHFVIVRKMALIDSTTIGQLFAHALVNNAHKIDKAVRLLEKLINQETMEHSDLLADTVTETSINKELQMASSSKLRNSSAYQQFIMSSTQNSNKSKDLQDDSDDDNDEIDALVAPKSAGSTLNESSKTNNVIVNSILKSPRKSLNDDYYEQNQSLKSTDKVSTGMLRSSKETKLPVHLRDFDDSEESDDSDDDPSDKGTIKLEKEYDFYK